MILKIFRKLNIYVHRIYYTIYYRNRLKIRGKISFRKSFIVLIEKNAKVEIGSNCFFNNYCSINSLNNIKIGNNCIFGENVKMYDHNHIFNKNELVAKSGYNVDEIVIGDNVWIGSNVVILKGVHIGNNCVIGAGTVVSQNVEDNMMLYSNRDSICEKINRRD